LFRERKLFWKMVIVLTILTSGCAAARETAVKGEVRPEKSLAEQRVRLKELEKERLENYKLLERLYEIQQDYRKAAEMYEKALGLAVDKTKFYRKLGRLYEQAGMNEKGIAIYLKLIEMYPEKKFDYGERLSRLYGETGAREKALTLGREMVEEYPNDARSHYLLAKIYSEHKMDEEAVTEYKKAIELDGDRESICRKRLELGKIYQRMDKNELAEREYHKVLENATREWMIKRAKDKLIKVYEAKGDYQKAVELYQERLASPPRNERWSFLLRRRLTELYLKMDKGEDALRLWKDMLKGEPGDAPLYEQLARICFLEKNYKEAISFYQKAIEVIPKEGNRRHYQLGLADVYQAVGEEEKAKELYKKAIILGENMKLLKGWPQPTYGRIMGSPVIGDMDNDGDMEIAIVALVPTKGGKEGKLFVWHHNGKLMKGWPQTVIPEDEYASYQSTWHRIGGGWHASPALGDIDGDGDLEIFSNSITEKLYGFHYDGKPLPGWPKDLGVSTYWMTPAVGDIDGDGHPEVLCAGMIIPAKGKPREYVGGRAKQAFDDIDNDGDIEIAYSWRDTIDVRHYDGTEMNGWPQKTLYLTIYPPVLGDFDGDGFLEIAMGERRYRRLYIWRYNGEEYLDGDKDPATKGIFALDAGGGYETPVFADLDGDGDLEIISYAVDRLYAFHHDGREVLDGDNDPTTKGVLMKMDRGSRGSPVVGDIGGDGKMEIICGGYLIQYDGKKVTSKLLIKNTGFKYSAAIGDLDRDGDAEIVLPGADGRVYILDLDESYQPELMQWPMFMHDMNRTGSAGRGKAVVDKRRGRGGIVQQKMKTAD